MFWAYWIALVLCVAAEWSMISWGAEFLVEVRDLRKADASLVMTLFFAAMVAGRAGGSHLTRLMDTRRLILGAIGVVAIAVIVRYRNELIADLPPKN